MKRVQAGLSMIEMLIAIVLGSIAIDAAVSLFAANRGTASTTAAIGALSDNGRVALDSIGNSVRSGGAMACNAINDIRGVVFTPGAPLRAKSILTVGGSPLQRDFTEAFGGYEAAGTSPVGGTVMLAAAPVVADPSGLDWTGGLDGLLLNQVVQGSDILAVRESTPQAEPVYTTLDYNNAAPAPLSVNSVGNLQPGQFAVISNCTYSTVFQVGAVDPVGLTIATTGPLDLAGGNLGWYFERPSSITPVDMWAFYIGPGRDGDSSLFAFQESTGQFQELVPDVENMQVLYGVASTTPDQVTEYVTADQVVDFNQVVSVKVAVLVASAPGSIAVPIAVQTYNLLGTTVTAPLDGRLRKVFDTTIAVENASL